MFIFLFFRPYFKFFRSYKIFIKIIVKKIAKRRSSINKFISNNRKNVKIKAISKKNNIIF